MNEVGVHAALRPHALSVEEVFRKFGSTPRGLSQNEARTRLQTYGANRIAAEQKIVVSKFAANFFHLMAVLLWVAGGLALLAGLPQIAIAVWLVNIVNGLFSCWQEYKAERALESLVRLLPHCAVVCTGTASSFASIAKNLYRGT
jgi:P-type Ca2+ transporter type 2C